MCPPKVNPPKVNIPAPPPVAPDKGPETFKTNEKSQKQRTGRSKLRIKRKNEQTGAASGVGVNLPR